MIHLLCQSYFINIKFLACFSSTRVYEPPDPPGYFDGHVWPMYLKHRQEMNTITWEIGKYLPSFLQGLLLLIYVEVQKGLLGKHFSQGVCKEMLRQPRGSPHLQLILAGLFFPWWFLSNLSRVHVIRWATVAWMWPVTVGGQGGKPSLCTKQAEIAPGNSIKNLTLHTSLFSM